MIGFIPQNGRKYEFAIVLVGSRRQVAAALKVLPSRLKGREKKVSNLHQSSFLESVFEVRYPCSSSHSHCNACTIDTDPRELFALYLPGIQMRIASHERVWKYHAQRAELLLLKAVTNLEQQDIEGYTPVTKFRIAHELYSGPCGIHVSPLFTLEYFGLAVVTSSERGDFITRASAWIEGRDNPSLTIRLLNLHKIIDHKKSDWRKGA